MKMLIVTKELPAATCTVKTSKFSKVFSPSNETDSTADSTFNPSTIALSRTPRQNAWANGPPVNVTLFDCCTSSSKVSVNPTVTTCTSSYYGQHQRTNESTYLQEMDDSNDNHDDDDSNSTTPLIRPSAAHSDITNLIEKALTKERNALNHQIAQLEMRLPNCGNKNKPI